MLWFAYCSTCNLIFSSLKLGNRLKRHVRKVTGIKYGFVKLFVIFLLVIQDVVMWFLLIYFIYGFICFWWFTHNTMRWDIICCDIIEIAGVLDETLLDCPLSSCVWKIKTCFSGMFCLYFYSLLSSFIVSKWNWTKNIYGLNSHFWIDESTFSTL